MRLLRRVSLSSLTSCVDGLRLERPPRVALFHGVQLTAVADENREPAGRVRGNLDRDGRDRLLAAIAAGEDLERRGPAGARPDVVEPDALDGDPARRLGGCDRDVQPLERDRLDVVREEHRDRPGHGRRRAENGRVAGEDVLDVQIPVALDARAALDGDGRRAELPLVRRERVEHRHVGDERREHLIVDELVFEGPLLRVLAAACLCAVREPLERDRHRHERRALAERAGDRRRTILRHGADRLAHRRDLEGRHQAREDRVDVGARHRELGGSEIVEGVPERVDLVAVDVGDRAGRAHVDVSAGERDADGIALAERPGRHRRLRPGRHAGDHRREARVTKCPEYQIDGLGLEAAHEERRRNRPEHRADLRAGGGRHPNRLHVGWPAGKRRQARRRAGERGREPFARDRQLELRLSGARAAGQGRRVLHLGNRRDAGDRFLRERADRVGNRADEAAVDVDRAAAHALRDT